MSEYDTLSKLNEKTSTLKDNLELLSLPLNKLKIMGSYASYSSTGGYYSKESNENILKKNLLLKNRFIHLDIFYDIINNERVPIVKSIINKKGFSFENACKTIKTYGFSSYKIHQYPLILYLNLNYADIDKEISNKIADILIKVFQTKLLGYKYAYGFQKKNQNLAQEQLNNFMNKIIILSNYSNLENKNHIKRTNTDYLNELINSFVKVYDNINDLFNETENINFRALEYHSAKNDTLINLYHDSLENIDDSHLSELFLIAIPNYKNKKRNPITYNLDIMNSKFSRFNVLPQIFYKINETHNNQKIKDLLIKYILYFTNNTFFSPITTLK